MKKLMAFLLCLILICFTGCGGGKNDSEKADSQNQEIKTSDEQMIRAEIIDGLYTINAMTLVNNMNSLFEKELSFDDRYFELSKVDDSGDKIVSLYEDGKAYSLMITSDKDTKNIESVLFEMTFANVSESDKENYALISYMLAMYLDEELLAQDVYDVIENELSISDFESKGQREASCGQSYCFYSIDDERAQLFITAL